MARRVVPAWDVSQTDGAAVEWREGLTGGKEEISGFCVVVVGGDSWVRARGHPGRDEGQEKLTSKKLLLSSIHVLDLVSVISHDGAAVLMAREISVGTQGVDIIQ